MNLKTFRTIRSKRKLVRFAELHQMEVQDVIETVTQPTDWCAHMLPVVKPTGAVRICGGLQNLNMHIKSKVRHQLLTTEETLGKLSGSTVFTSLDQQVSGRYHCTKREASFITSSFGRYYFKRLLFGISVAPGIPAPND